MPRAVVARPRMPPSASAASAASCSRFSVSWSDRLVDVDLDAEGVVEPPGDGLDVLRRRIDQADHLAHQDLGEGEEQRHREEAANDHDEPGGRPPTPAPPHQEVHGGKQGEGDEHGDQQGDQEAGAGLEDPGGHRDHRQGHHRGGPNPGKPDPVPSGRPGLVGRQRRNPGESAASASAAAYVLAQPGPGMGRGTRCGPWRRRYPSDVGVPREFGEGAGGVGHFAGGVGRWPERTLCGC